MNHVAGRNFNKSVELLQNTEETNISIQQSFKNISIEASPIFLTTKIEKKGKYKKSPAHRQMYFQNI